MKFCNRESIIVCCVSFIALEPTAGRADSVRDIGARSPAYTNSTESCGFSYSEYAAGRFPIAAPVWNAVIPKVVFTNARLSDVLRFVEDESFRLNPHGRGVRILGWHEGIVSVTLTNVSLRAIMDHLYGSDVSIVDDIALIKTRGNTAWRRTAAVWGWCRDAQTSEPIRFLRITAGLSPGWKGTSTSADGQVVADRYNGVIGADDGHFIGYVTYLVGSEWVPGVGFLHGEEYDKIQVTVEARGYKARPFNLYVGDSRGPTGIQEPLDVRLERNEGYGRSLFPSGILSARNVHVIWSLCTVLLLVLVLWERRKLLVLRSKLTSKASGVVYGQ